MIYSFVGKGGVGKTTVSSALAIELSSLGFRTCIISMDLMPMTHYILNKPIPNLDVIEYTEKDAQNEWRIKYGDEVYELISSFFTISSEIIDHIEKAPGIADEFIFSKLLDIRDKYNYIVWDTAASSSTLHLLLAEKEFYEHINRDIKFYLSIKDKLSKIKKGSYDPLIILNKWKELAKNVWDLIRNEVIFYIVETDDDLSFIQADEIEKELKSMDLKVSARILNRSKGKHKEDISIPELSGTPREIAEGIRPYIRRLLH